MPGPMVLLYHRVALLPNDPHLLAVTPEHFEEHLLTLLQHFRVVPLSEMTASLSRGGTLGPVVAITFDDGYADNAEVALPLLAKHDIPTTFYLSSGFVGSTREQLQDELERLLLLSQQCPDQLQLTVGGKAHSWDMRSRVSADKSGSPISGWDMESGTYPTPRHLAYREIHTLMRALSPAERDEALEQLRCQCGDPGQARSSHRAMSWDQARQMAACELTDLGAHTVNHPFLSSLSPKMQLDEILKSKKMLEAQTGRPVSSFAYPYGTRQSYTLETVDVVKELDFKNACSNFRGHIGRATDPFQIPRFVVRDWDGDEFSRQLRQGRL